MRILSLFAVLLLAGCLGAPAGSPAPAPMAPPPPPMAPPAPKPTAMPRPAPQSTEVTSSTAPTEGVSVSSKVKAEQRKTTVKIVKEPQTDPILDQLFKAAMSFVVPDSTNIANDFKVQLLIDPSKEEDQLAKALTVKGAVTKAKIQISKVAIAKLTAPDFEVISITPEQQALTSTEPTEWLWELQPKSAGSHDIQLTITAVIKVDGDKSEHHLKTFEKTVTVEITTMQVVKAWFTKYWQWMFSTLLLPFGIWIYKEKIKRKAT